MKENTGILNKWLIKTDKVERQFVRFVTAGLVTASFDIGLLYALTEFLDIYYLISVAIAFIVATGISYILNVTWIFWDGRHQKQLEIIFFFTASGGGVLLNEAFIFLLVEYLLTWYIVAKIVAIGIVVIFNFWSRKRLIFAY